MFRAETLFTTSEIRAMRSMWEELYLVAGGMAAQSPAYVLAACETALAGAKIAVVLVWRGERLVGVWPLSLTTKGSIRYAVHSGCGGNEEYAGALIEPGEDTAEIAALAVIEARKHADVVTVFNTVAQSAILDALRSRSILSRNWSVRSYVVGLREFDTWEAWLKSKTKNFRQGLGGQRRNLTKLGELVSVQDEPDMMPWFFAAKRDWLRASGKKTSWVDDPEIGENFFSQLQTQPGTPLKTFGLKLNGSYIAGGICLVSPGRFEYYSTVYSRDGGYDRYSPGMLVSEDCGRWALDHKLDLDFRFMDVPYKERWCSRTEEVSSVMAALDLRGVAPVGAAMAEGQMRKFRRRLGSLRSAIRKPQAS